MEAFQATWLFVDRPRIQLKGANTETPEHLGVHHLKGIKRKQETENHLQNKIKGNTHASLLIYL